MSTVTLERRLETPPARRVGGPPDWLLVALLAALATGLGLFELGTRSLWLDESATVAITAQHGSALWDAIARDGGNMLGYYLLLHALTGLFGDATTVIRLPSVVGFVGTVVLVFLIARRLFDRRAAVAAAALTAVSVPLVFWGQDARSYAVMTMLISASFLSLIALIERPRSRRAWAAYVVTTVLAVYMSLVAALVVPAQLLVLVGCRRAARAVLSATAVVAAACIPLAVLAIERGRGQLFWVPPLSLGHVGEMARWLSSAGMPPNFHRTATGTLLLVLSLAALVAVLAVVVWDRRRTSWRVWLVVSWLLVPLALILAESLTGQPIALARSSLVALPAVSIVLGRGLTRVPRAPWLGYAVIGTLLVLRVLQLAPSYGVSPENWQAAARHVLAATRAGDCIAFYPSDGRMAFGYYVPAAAAAPTPVLPASPWGQTTPYVERYVAPPAAALAQIAARCSRFWLVASHEGVATGSDRSRANLARYQALRSALRRAYSRRVTATYGWASPVRVSLFDR
jgi:mannosyltransferase